MFNHILSSFQNPDGWKTLLLDDAVSLPINQSDLMSAAWKVRHLQKTASENSPAAMLGSIKEIILSHSSYSLDKSRPRVSQSYCLISSQNGEMCSFYQVIPTPNSSWYVIDADLFILLNIGPNLFFDWMLNLGVITQHFSEPSNVIPPTSSSPGQVVLLSGMPQPHALP